MIFILREVFWIALGCSLGCYFASKFFDRKRAEMETSHALAMRNEIDRHAAQVAKNGMMFNIEQQELIQRHAKMLDEISQVTGIDVIDLPSFGKVCLNQSGHPREAMHHIYEEDESDGTYD